MRNREHTNDLLGSLQTERDNLSPAAVTYLKTVGAGAEDLFFHALAVLHAPAYRSHNAAALRQDWPRIPLPAQLETLKASASLGRRVAALLDTETPVPGVTSAPLLPELQAIGQIARKGGGALSTEEFALTAGWGHAGKDAATMPGRGKSVLRDAVPCELARPFAAATNPKTGDIWLNDHAYWKNIPPAVWDYTLGGYQVMKKWLSYREKPLLGRARTADEVREVTAMAWRIAALIALNGELDASYQSVKAHTMQTTGLQ